jgi:hypothetical protein
MDGLCSREHQYCWIVLPGAQSRGICAPGNTVKQNLCSREHNPAIFVLPGAQATQASSICAPGNTNNVQRERAKSGV